MPGRPGTPYDPVVPPRFEAVKLPLRSSRSFRFQRALSVNVVVGMTEPDGPLIDERNAARASKNFARADQLRDELLAAGIELEDSRDGTIWRLKD